MRYFHQGRFQQQFNFLRQQFLQDGDLPFCNTLSEQTVAEALKAIETCFLDRIYSPLVTLWVFLGQVLSQDHSCRAAVARLISFVFRGKSEPVPPRRALIAWPESDCLKNSSWTWLAEQEGHWTPRPKNSGFGSDAVSWRMTDRPYRCRTPRRTNRLIHNRRSRSRASVFRWHALLLSFLSRAERWWNWEYVVTRVRETANWECFADYGMSCMLGMSCSQIGICVLGPNW